MKLATVAWGQEQRWGVVEDECIRLAPEGEAGTLAAQIASGSALPKPADWPAVALADVELLAPLPEPRRNVICLGLNYADHAAEVQGVAPKDAELPSDPMFFTKATTTINGPRSAVVLDERVTRRLDWEVELAFIIGRGGRFIPADEAMAYVFGYTVFNDLSARDLQKRHQQFFLGKSVDGSAPMGPWIVTPEEIPDPHALDLSCTVNGVTKQASNTRQLIFGVAQIIEILSRAMTLMPGDIIATGTPGGVGFARTPREFLQSGDEVTCWIDGIGSLENRVVAA